MTDDNNKVLFALEFPQGYVLFLKKENSSSAKEIGGIYFNPHKSQDAFVVWGERKELFGKHAVTVAKDSKTGGGDYSLVYEFKSDGTVYDARLVSKTATVHGALVDGNALQYLNMALAQGKITLHSHQDTAPDSVFNVAQFSDGRMLIQLYNKNELYLGIPGNYQKLDADLLAQAGNGMYYKLKTGEIVDLPYGMGVPRPGEPPTFNGEKLEYLKINSREPASFGLDLSQPQSVVRLDPFSPSLTANAKVVPTPKPPRP